MQKVKVETKKKEKFWCSYFINSEGRRAMYATSVIASLKKIFEHWGDYEEKAVV